MCMHGRRYAAPPTVTDAELAAAALKAGFLDKLIVSTWDMRIKYKLPNRFEIIRVARVVRVIRVVRVVKVVTKYM
jgi:hypothetical protein